MRNTRRRLQVLRAEQDVTQAQVARKAGLSASRYWQLENGEGYAPSRDLQEAVATALGVKVSDIAWPEHELKASAS